MKKWIFRLLVLIAVLGALALFGIQIASGTSDTHKRGLEQAFSQIFGGEATFGKLKTFNLIPQFAVEIEDLHVLQIKGVGNMSADNLLIAFGPIDLITKSRVIEDFKLKNFTANAGVFTPLALSLTDVGIYPNEKRDAANLNISGKYGDKELKGQFAMSMKSGVRSKYTFNDDNEFTMNLGAFQISGLFSPYAEKGANMHHVKMFAQAKEGRLECNLPPEKSLELTAFFKDLLGQIETVKTPAELKTICDTLSK